MADFPKQFGVYHSFETKYVLETSNAGRSILTSELQTFLIARFSSRKNSENNNVAISKRDEKPIILFAQRKPIASQRNISEDK